MIQIKRKIAGVETVIYTLGDDPTTQEVESYIDILDGSIVRRELMGEHYARIRFSLATPIYLRTGDYIDLTSMGYCRFELTSPYVPKYNPDNAGFDFDITFDAYYKKWANKICMFRPASDVKETEFDLTAKLDTHLETILSNINYWGGVDDSFRYNGQAFTYDIQEGFGEKMVHYTYQNVSIEGALSALAGLYDCEWWVDGGTIFFGKYEHGTAVTFQLGIDDTDNVVGMDSSGSNGTYANRLYVFGSTRNIPSNYREVQGGDTLTGVVQKRLMLPVSSCPNGYIQETVENESQIIEDVLILDDIYPKATLIIKAVDTYTVGTGEEERTYYRLKYKKYNGENPETPFIFKEEYRLDGEELRIVFESGAMNGMDFEVVFNPLRVADEASPDAQVLEIVANEEYGVLLPASTLIPSVGDLFVIYGWDTTKIEDMGLVAQAEQELYAAGIEEFSKSKVDSNTYTCTMWGDSETSEYDMGQRITLVNPAFEETNHIRTGFRITGYEKKLDIPYDQPKYIIGKRAFKKKKLSDMIADLNLGGIGTLDKNTYGDMEKVYRDCGEWVKGDAQGVTPSVGYGIYVVDEYDPTAMKIVTHDVWHYGAMWRCLVRQPVVTDEGGVETVTYYEPKWKSPYWQRIAGDSTLKIELSFSGGNLFERGSVDTTIIPRLLIGSEDITDQVDAEYWSWERSCDMPNAERRQADAVWNEGHTGIKILSLTNADMPEWWSTSNRIRFKAKANVDGELVTAETFVQMMPATGQRGIDGNGIEWVFVRTTTDTAPTVNTSEEAGGGNAPYDGKTYHNDMFQPLSSAGRCTNTAQGGLTKNGYKYEWYIMRTKASPVDGERDWMKYSGTMLLWTKYVESISKESETYRYAVTNASSDHPSELSQSWVLTKQQAIDDYTDEPNSTLPQNAVMWTKTDILWNDNSHTILYSGDRNPNDGQAGQSIYITDQSVTYSVSQTQVADPSQLTYGNYPSSLNEGDWLYSKTTVVYSDTHQTNSFSASRIGSDGVGTEGRGISKVEEYYALSASKTTAPADSQFDKSVKTPTKNLPYLWNYELVTYTKGSPSTSKSTKQVIGTYSENGRGIDSIVNHYVVTSHGSGVTTSDPDDGTWTTTVQAVTPTLKYLWNYETINYIEADGTTTTPDDTDPHIIGVYGDKGEDGISPIYADLDNEMSGIACNSNGVVSSEQPVNTYAKMFRGITPLTITSITCKIGDVTLGTSYASSTSSIAYYYKVSVTPSTGYVVVTVRNGATISTKTDVDIYVTDGTEERKLTLTINGVRAGDDGEPAVIYNLRPSASSIRVGRTDSGGYTPTTFNLTCGYLRNNGGAMSAVDDATSKIDSTYYIYFRRRTRSNSTWEATYYRYGYSTYKAYVTSLDVTTYDLVEFIMCTATGTYFSASSIGSYTVIDKETVPVISDGLNGTSVEARYAPNDNPTSSEIHTTFQSGDMYMSTRESGGSWSDWQKIVGEDGDSTNFEFGISQYQTATGAPSDITEWADAPIATTSSKPYLWSKVTTPDGTESYIRLTGEKGASGVDGYNTATLFLYKRSSTEITQIDWSNTLTYTFSTKSLNSVPTGWSLNVIPSGTDPLYVTAATAYSRSTTDTIASNEWSAPVLFVENGSQGEHGLNTASVFLYQRATSTPSKPSGSLTYTFSTGVLSGTLGSWSQTIPTTDGKPCWVIQATAVSTGETDAIASSEWSTQRKLVIDGENGAPGGNTATVFLYSRTKSTIDWTDTLTYTFETKSLNSVPSGWSLNTIPSGTTPVYVTAATAYSTGATDTIAYTEWATPVKFVENGGQGAHGLNAASIYLYQRSASAPAKPSYSLIYTFETGELSGNLGNWSQYMPSTDSSHNPCWVIQATAIGTGSTDTIATSEWSEQKKLVEDGAKGDAGGNTATIYLYKRSSTAISTVGISSKLYYKFSTKKLYTNSTATTEATTQLNGWSLTIPSNSTDPIYVTAAIAYSNTEVDDIATSEWVTPAKFTENGAEGGHGINTAVVFIYKRASSQPSDKPTGKVTYTFASGDITLESGKSWNSWSTTIPSTNGNPCWVRQAIALGNGDTDDIETTDWSDVTKLVADGATGLAGYNTATIFLYSRTNSTITWSNSLTYTFSTKSLSSVPSGWSLNAIPSGTDPIYVTAATATSRESTDSIDANEWATPVLFSENGDAGLNSATVFLYQRSSSTPSKPSSSLTYTFSTGVLSGTLGSWSQSIPTVNGNPCWITQATAIATTSTDTIASSEWSTVSKLVEDGTSPIVVDLTNENDSMVYDEFGVLKSGNVTSEAKLYVGSQDKSADATWTITPTNCTLSSGNSRNIVVTGMSALSATVTASASYGNGNYTAILSLKKLINEDKYELDVTPVSIGYNSTTNTPASQVISVSIWKVSHVDGSRTRSNPPSGYEVRLYKDGSDTSHAYSGSYSDWVNNPWTYTLSPLSSWSSCLVKLNNGTNNSTSAWLDYETIPIAKTADGTSPYFADLDNEMDSIACTSAGAASSSYDKTINVNLWHGSTPISLTSLSYKVNGGSSYEDERTIGNVKITPSKTNKTVRIQVSSGDSVSRSDITITIAGTGSGNHDLHFILNPIKDGGEGTPATIFSLLPSVSAIKKDANNVLTPTSLTCDVRKITGNSTPTRATSSDGTLRYRIDGDITSTSDGTALTINTGTVNSYVATSKFITFAFFKGTTLVDKERVPIVYDGAKGDAGKGYKTIVYRDNFTEAQWAIYGAIDHTETWDGTSSARNGCGVGDWFLVVGTATDSKDYHTATYECDNSSSNLHGKCINHQVTKNAGQMQTNIIRESHFNTLSYWSAHVGEVVTNAIGDHKGFKFSQISTASYNSALIQYMWDNSRQWLSPSTVYTLSFWLKSDASTSSAYTYFYDYVVDPNYLPYVDGVRRTSASSNYTQYGRQDWESTNGSWVYHTFTFKTKDTRSSYTWRLLFGIWGTGTATATICMPKLELGDKASGYMLADEEMGESYRILYTWNSTTKIEVKDLPCNADYSGSFSGNFYFYLQRLVDGKWNDCPNYYWAIKGFNSSGGINYGYNGSSKQAANSISSSTVNNSTNRYFEVYFLTEAMTPAGSSKAEVTETTTRKIFMSSRISKVPAGENGTSPWFADLSNEMDAVACDKLGYVAEAKSVTTTANLFHGSSKENCKISTVMRGTTTLNNGSATSGVTGVTASWSTTPAQGITLTIAYATTAKISGKDTYTITVTDSAGGNSSSLTLVVNGVQGDVYQLLPNVSEVVFGVDANNEWTPSSIGVYCGYTKNVGGTITEYAGNIVANTWKSGGAPYNIFYRYQNADSSWTSYYWNKDETNGTISVANSYTYTAIQFVLTSATGVGSVTEDKVLDRETLPITKAGKQGAAGENATSLSLSADKFYVDNKVNGYVVETGNLFSLSISYLVGGEKKCPVVKFGSTTLDSSNTYLSKNFYIKGVNSSSTTYDFALGFTSQSSDSNRLLLDGGTLTFNLTAQYGSYPVLPFTISLSGISPQLVSITTDYIALSSSAVDEDDVIYELPPNDMDDYLWKKEIPMTTDTQPYIWKRVISTYSNGEKETEVSLMENVGTYSANSDLDSAVYEVTPFKKLLKCTPTTFHLNMSQNGTIAKLGSIKINAPSGGTRGLTFVIVGGRSSSDNSIVTYGTASQITVPINTSTATSISAKNLSSLTIEVRATPNAYLRYYSNKIYEEDRFDIILRNTSNNASTCEFSVKTLIVDRFNKIDVTKIMRPMKLVAETCATDAGTSMKRVTLSSTTLSVGLRFKVTFTYGNTADENVSLIINGVSSSQWPLYWNGKPASSTNAWAAGTVMEIAYIRNPNSTGSSDAYIYSAEEFNSPIPYGKEDGFTGEEIRAELYATDPFGGEYPVTAAFNKYSTSTVNCILSYEDYNESATYALKRVSAVSVGNNSTSEISYKEIKLYYETN